MMFTKQLHKLGNIIWKNKIYVALTICAIFLTLRALLANSNANMEIPNTIEAVDYSLNGVAKENVYKAIDSNGYFAKQDFYNAYIGEFIKINNLPNASHSYEFNFFGPENYFNAVRVNVNSTYTQNGQTKTLSIVEYFTIIKDI